MTEEAHENDDPVELLREIGERSLSDEERADLFAGAWTDSAPARDDEEGDEPVSLADARRKRRPAIAGGIALVAAAALALAVFWPHGAVDDPVDRGIKSASQGGSVELRAFVGERDGGVPKVGHELGDRETVDEDAGVLFRYRVDRSARLVLYAGDGSVEELWSADVNAGEGEVSSKRQALALPARSYAGGVTVALVAYFGDPPFTPPASLTPGALDGSCTRCSYDVFEFGGVR